MFDRFPFLKRELRNGTERIFVRRRGRTRALKAAPETAAFALEYARALEELSGLPAKPKKAALSVRTPTPGTMGALAARYFKSTAFEKIDAVTQRRRRSTIEACLRVEHKGRPLRDCPVRLFTSQHVRDLRDEVGHKPGAANHRIKHLSSMFGWAVEEDIAKANPCRDVKRVRYEGDGFHTWTVAELEKFEERWPIGTKPRLAFALIRYLGVRRSDVVRLGRQHVRDAAITFVPAKTRKARPKPSTKPILPQLARIIEAGPTGALTFLETAFGKPYSAAGFGNAMRAWCDAASLPQCSAHGIRKAAATKAAEEGATVHQLMAIFDWATPQQAEPYTRAANRTKMSADAMPLLAKEQN